MFCGHCGTKNRNDDHFCGICGAKLPDPQPEVIYLVEKPLESILDNSSVLLLAFFFFALAMIAIISVSSITKDLPSSNKLEGIPSHILY